MDSSEFLVAALNDEALVSVKGRAVYTTCSDFAKFLDAFCRDARYKSLIIDFGECTGVDSTMLGLLTQAANELKSRNAELIIQRANDRIEEVIVNLGLDLFAKLLKGGITHAGTDEMLAAGTKSTHKAAPADNATILAAHESLVAANKKNALKFKQIVEFMKADLGLS